MITENAQLRELNGKLHAQFAEDTARWSGKAFAAEKQVLVLREALQYAIKQVPALATVPGIRAAMEISLD